MERRPYVFREDDYQKIMQIYGELRNFSNIGPSPKEFVYQMDNIILTELNNRRAKVVPSKFIDDETHHNLVDLGYPWFEGRFLGVDDVTYDEKREAVLRAFVERGIEYLDKKRSIDDLFTLKVDEFADFD